MTIIINLILVSQSVSCLFKNVFQVVAFNWICMTLKKQNFATLLMTKVYKKVKAMCETIPLLDVQEFGL